MNYLIFSISILCFVVAGSINLIMGEKNMGVIVMMLLMTLFIIDRFDEESTKYDEVANE